MTVRHGVVIGVTASLLWMPGAGQSQAPQRWSYGIGVRSCRSWTQDQTAGHWEPGLQWMLGFITAVNMYAPTPPREAYSSAVRSWVSAYCQANPRVNIEVAAHELVKALGSSGLILRME